ncbi:hypothetical protein PILCRDRAFT_199296 [Piloderma croceum F 1598]|uniref:Uncharacterized protein n=1 Tax=Piloderma croceum (strain F 1598) TaxID=765440 RepID=A0A0C3BTH7_PILCF|nr:hypothetical protein PILCRDRAFT_199296 [Piloderma croceum F 1598]
MIHTTRSLSWGGRGLRALEVHIAESWGWCTWSLLEVDNQGLGCVVDSILCSILVIILPRTCLFKIRAVRWSTEY